ncbi:MAG: thiamine pyrophosphate-binding protein [Pseudomonadota bacterium]
MTDKVRCSTAVIAALESVGVDTAFVYNGHGNWALLDSLKYESNIRGISCRGEGLAVHMADGYSRARSGGAIPIVSTSVGPGNMNIASALSNAFFESSAMIVLAGGGATHWQDRGGIEEYYRYGPDEWIQTVKTYTKKVVMVSRPDTAVDAVLRAYKTAVTGRPGPVVLQLPFDIQNSMISARSFSSAKQLTEVAPPGPDRNAIKRAVELLKQAQKPLVMVSGGVSKAGAREVLKEFLEEFNIPVVTTTMGKASYPEDRPMSLGVLGRSGSGLANRAARECDLLIGIGTHFSDIDTGGWTLFDIPGSTKLIHIDIDESEIARVYPTEVGIWSDAKLAIEALLTELRNEEAASTARTGSDSTEWLGGIASWREDWETEKAELLADASELGYAKVCETVGSVLTKDHPNATVFVDTGHLLSFAPAFMTLTSQKFNHCGFFHCMGWSLPAALGAKFRNPDEPVITLMGDGSFLFSNSALATCFEYDKPLTVIVLSNRSLQIERELMRRVYGRSAYVDYKVQSTEAPWNPDFMMLAKAMGVNAMQVSTPEELASAVTESINSGKTNVIEVDIDVESSGYRSVWYAYPNDFWAEVGAVDETF